MSHNNVTLCHIRCTYLAKPLCPNQTYFSKLNNYSGIGCKENVNDESAIIYTCPVVLMRYFKQNKPEQNSVTMT